MIKTAILAALGIGIFVAMAMIEKVTDEEEITLLGFLFELGAAAVVFGAVALVSLSTINFKQLHDERVDLIARVENANFEGAQWRQLADGYVKGLGVAITSQFNDWGLTESESEIAMLILKGFSNREIGSFRRTSEATVRQQASTIYGKSGLRNHRELSAYFLEDLTPEKSGYHELKNGQAAFSN